MSVILTKTQKDTVICPKSLSRCGSWIRVCQIPEPVFLLATWHCLPVPDSIKIPPILAWPGQAWGLSFAAWLDRREQDRTLLGLVRASCWDSSWGCGQEASCLSRLVGDSWGICFSPDGQWQPGWNRRNWEIKTKGGRGRRGTGRKEGARSSSPAERGECETL